MEPVGFGVITVHAGRQRELARKIGSNELPHIAMLFDGKIVHYKDPQFSGNNVMNSRKIITHFVSQFQKSFIFEKFRENNRFSTNLHIHIFTEYLSRKSKFHISTQCGRFKILLLPIL